eukprot:TRINITY_DN68_c1_g1_i1.p1 TRINITY_DN68_c1_g1~~TRINITY_DN68_c1_g1_i1.p1  ORF type:complete len:404 (+),score=129.88 TRINITY_DN68_c1_g1_i1:152-1363(+)
MARRPEIQWLKRPPDEPRVPYFRHSSPVREAKEAIEVQVKHGSVALHTHSLAADDDDDEVDESAFSAGGDAWVRLNVGGQVFSVSRQTLTLDEHSVLGRMFAVDGALPSARDDSGAVLVDRDPVYFRVILSYLRSGKLLMDNDISLEGVKAEAEYFQLKGLLMLIHSHKTPDLTRSQLIAQRGTITSFEGVRLMGVDLAHLSFTEERFYKARMERVDLTDTNLASCTFRKTSLAHACLIDADCRYAKFSESDLSSACLRHADLPYAQFTAVNLSNASLRDAFCAGTLFQKSCLRGADFTGAVLMQAKFQDCDLRNATLMPREYAGENRYFNVHFTGADIRGAIVNWTDVGKLEKALFRHAKVTEEEYLQIPLSEEQKLFLELHVVQGAQSISSFDDFSEDHSY